MKLIKFNDKIRKNLINGKFIRERIYVFLHIYKKSMKIFKYSVIAILLIATILIGSPISFNCTELSIIIILFGIIFSIYKFFIKKQRILNDKLDILVLLFCLTPFIPIVFNTYISLSDSITSLLKYISCFVVYIIIKNLAQNDEKYKNTIINTIIFSSVILSIFGIDYMTTRIFPDILESIGLPYIVNIENRMFASLGYANSFAVILAISVMLILHKINSRSINQKNIIKSDLIYSGILFLNLSCIILSYSRTVLLILAVIILAYLIINREKKKSIYTIYLLGIDGVLSLIYTMMWNFESAWLMTAFMFIISCFALELIDRIYDKIEKITKKTYAIIIVVCVIGIVLFISVGINLTRPLTIYEANSSSGMVKYKIQNIEPNTDYSLKFDINAKSTLNNIENYKITVSEENKYYDTVEEHEITFNNFEGIKEISFTTSNETIEFAIYIESEYKIAQLGLTINSLTINGEEHPLNYLYLPVSIVDKIKDINLNDKSVWERGNYYKDAFKIIKDDWATGLGANAWRYKYLEVQEYNYSATEVHSFPIQILLENGILSVILLGIIIILIIFRLIKDRKAGKNNVGIFLALILLILHSFVDFDMSFYYIMMLFFTLLAILPYQNQKDEKSRNIIEIILLLAVLIVAQTLGITNAIYNLESKTQIIYSYYYNKEYDNSINAIRELNKTEKYDNYFDIYGGIDYSQLSNENLEYIYNEIIKTPITVNVEYDMQKNRVIERIINTTNNEEIKTKLAQIIIDENDEYVEMINNKEKNRLINNEIKSYINEQEKIYELAKSITNK